MSIKRSLEDVNAVFCQGRIQNHLGAPFVAHEFAWWRILNKCTVISSDKQNNDRKMSDCLSLTCSLFVLLTALKQFIYLKLQLNIINHVSHSYLITLSRIKHYWFFLFFVNGDHHIFTPPQKKTHIVWKIKIITAIVSQT